MVLYIYICTEIKLLPWASARICNLEAGEGSLFSPSMRSRSIQAWPHKREKGAGKGRVSVPAIPVPSMSRLCVREVACMKCAAMVSVHAPAPSPPLPQPMCPPRFVTATYRLRIPAEVLEGHGGVAYDRVILCMHQQGRNGDLAEMRTRADSFMVLRCSRIAM